MKIFDAQYLDDLTGKAKVSPRLRQHRNVHQSYQDASQRLFNAIEPGSYIRPHRHASDPREELLIAVRGVMAMVTFDDQGAVTNVLRFGTEKHGVEMVAGAEGFTEFHNLPWWNLPTKFQPRWRKFIQSNPLNIITFERK